MPAWKDLSFEDQCEAYELGLMPPEERACFEEDCLIDPQRLNRLKSMLPEIDLLRGAAEAHVLEALAAQQKRSFWQGWLQWPQLGLAAASLLVAFSVGFGLSGWQDDSLEREIAKLQQAVSEDDEDAAAERVESFFPAAALPIFQLRALRADAALELPAEPTPAGAVLLTLEAEEYAELSPDRLVFVDLQGRERLRLEGLQADPRGRYYIALPESQFKGDAFFARLLRRDQLLAEFSLDWR